MGAEVWGPFAASAVGSILSRGGQSQASGIAGSILPSVINTGRSKYNTQTGKFKLDPRIQKSNRNRRSNIRGLRKPTKKAYDESIGGIRELRTDLADLRGDYEGNQSAYRAAQLAPLQERIATAEGNLDRELGRTNVRGTFANLSKEGLQLDSARELRNAEAQIENERINALGDFLQIDANLLKQGLASESGRVSMLAGLEQILAGMDTQRINQELLALGLPGRLAGASTAAAGINANAAGVVAQSDATLAGDIIGGIGTYWDQNAPTGGGGSGADGR